LIILKPWKLTTTGNIRGPTGTIIGTTGTIRRTTGTIRRTTGTIRGEARKMKGRAKHRLVFPAAEDAVGKNSSAVPH